MDISLYDVIPREILNSHNKPLVSGFARRLVSELEIMIPDEIVQLFDTFYM